MSSYSQSIRRTTLLDLQKKKQNKEPIVALTAYHAYGAKIADPYCDFMLVGDSVGMVIYGMENTLSVTVDMMINHGKAVVQSSKKSMIIVDMPFGSYEGSKEIAFKNASRILSDTGCSAVKLEGGEQMAETIAFLTSRGIPVMAHIGLTPQSVNIFGGFKAQGRTEFAQKKIENDAFCVEQAGAFSVVLEGMIESLAVQITGKIEIPTIGIGASQYCDGQILVTEDMLGFHEWTPKFVRRYANLQTHAQDAISAYAKDVLNRSFPDEKELYR